ncbi:hypothetical protein [Cellulophaga tyrosinoxydans]|uniref:Viral A-type inclusion protein n=1 Tax=Cellulophaga tyrosinoxydans TaxID=504486 RepID=A0A1W1Z514_9FLAO|nr:hypothetical protein [Cellulophaga tyrosinoxydans]SMC43519.1 hypothetical protein SAMN05660703_1163 [Cellulophaga tyrosinoxydans]
MKKLLILSVSLFSVLFFSCKDNEKSQTQTQMQQVMAVHDEVMPKMSSISKLISQLDAKIQAGDSTETYIKASQDLKDANKAMFDWMKGFSDRFDREEIMNGKALSAEKQKFLDEEEAKVKALRDQMNSSISNAEAILQ